MDDVSFEQWLEDYWRHPDTDLDASVAAVIEDRPVAFSHLRIAPGGRAVTDMTGTLRDYRGRGLALLAKRATLVNAAGRGVELVSTENDEKNAPMLRVNEKLGYRPIGGLMWSRSGCDAARQRPMSYGSPAVYRTTSPATREAA